MLRFVILCLVLLISPFLVAQSLMSAEELLDKSIQYHDPNGKWGTQMLPLKLTETRPNGADRNTLIHIDLLNEQFIIEQMRDGHQIIQNVTKGNCSYQLDGRAKISEEEKKKHRLNCQRSTTIRDYYTYLWGLPMKLKDPGTIISPDVKSTFFQGKSCYAIRIHYSEEVGKDIWYFYFDPINYELIGYRFYHDERKNDGEYITLEGIEKINGLHLPKKRNWYVNKDDQYLGSDILEQKN